MLPASSRSHRATADWLVPIRSATWLWLSPAANSVQEEWRRRQQIRALAPQVAEGQGRA
jgi:hypothetical protein